MEANKIMSADLLDLLFEGRNKDYGAYELRKRYNKRITLALVITAAIAVAALGASFLVNQFSGNNEKKVNIQDVVIQNVKENTPPPPPPPPPPKTPPPPKVEMTKFTPPVIKKDEEVKKQEVPPVEKLENTKIDVINQEGIKQDIIAPPVVDQGTKVVEVPKEDPNQVFTKVEIEARVDQNAWKRHLQSQLQRYIEDAASAGMEPGTYTVNVRFLVEKDGSINSVESLNDPGYGLAKGAVDVVKKGPRWTPGIQNGKQVRSYHTQPITFLIQE